MLNTRPPWLLCLTRRELRNVRRSEFVGSPSVTVLMVLAFAMVSLRTLVMCGVVTVVPEALAHVGASLMIPKSSLEGCDRKEQRWITFRIGCISLALRECLTPCVQQFSIDLGAEHERECGHVEPEHQTNHRAQCAEFLAIFAELV